MNLTINFKANENFYERHRQIQEKEKPQHLVVEGN